MQQQHCADPTLLKIQTTDGQIFDGNQKGKHALKGTFQHLYAHAAPWLPNKSLMHFKNLQSDVERVWAPQAAASLSFVSLSL